MSSVTPASGAAAAPEGAPSAAALRRADQLAARIEAALPAGSIRVANTAGEVTFELRPAQLLAAAKSLRDALGFEMLMDVCVVDYLQHGRAEWKTEHATLSGFSRGVARGMTSGGDERPGRRFGVSYHLLSIANNQRLRLKVYCEDDDQPAVDSVTAIWASADWFEREAFDLFGVMFRGHPDLRRILTDYGFIGHPFRKDFPLIGNVEVRYDPEKRRVVYQPVSIEARVLVPKVIRHDNRYNPELTAAPAASIAPVTPLIAPPPPAPPAPAAAAPTAAASTAAASTPPASAKT